MIQDHLAPEIESARGNSSKEGRNKNATQHGIRFYDLCPKISKIHPVTASETVLPFDRVIH